MTHIPSAYVAEIQGMRLLGWKPHLDQRGTFGRIYSQHELGMGNFDVKEIGLSENFHLHSLRGMHYQPNQAKIIRCIQGVIVDAALDVREGSETFGKNFCTTLSAQDKRSVYIPEGVAHGFQVLVAPATVLYLFSAPRDPDTERGVSWRDPRFNVPWPFVPTIMSERDLSFPMWSERHEK